MPTDTRENKIPHIQHKILHINQRFSWDCGIACVLMVLRDKDREYFKENFSKILQDEGLRQRTWTIDLCYLLKRFNIEHYMFTIRRDVNAKYSNIIPQDISRVRDKFKNAESYGLKIEEGFLSMQQITQHIINYGPAILLVDGGLLTCDSCKSSISAEFRRMFGSVYKGHYICVMGVRGNRLMYREPARAHALCVAAPHRLQLARAAPADFDVILIYN